MQPDIYASVDLGHLKDPEGQGQDGKIHHLHA